MCNECRQDPCDYRCPHAEETVRDYPLCPCCGDYITEGKRIQLYGDYVHYECFKEKPLSTKLEMLFDLIYEECGNNDEDYTKGILAFAGVDIEEV